VEPGVVGEALGAINGTKALTEGVGPLLFGSLMILSERSELPGWPNLVAALIMYMAYYYSQYLPDNSDDYVHELEQKKPQSPQRFLLNVLFGDLLQFATNHLQNMFGSSGRRRRVQGVFGSIQGHVE
jgi:hypothetical protein